MVSKTPAFNLKVVLKETGIAADTLRAWERRYGLPLPQRSAGGHRLYSQHDIETIKWLMRRQQDGLSISRAVDLWKDELASGSDPLADSVPTTLVPSGSFPAADTTLDSLRAQWIEACLNFNEAHAEQALNQAFSMFPVEAVSVEILQKGMAQIGNLWYENHASVQQEHFASNLAVRRLDALLSSSPVPTRPETVVLGCPPDEWHTLTPLLLALFLRRRGLNVLYLGANVPVSQFSEMVKAAHADLVVLAAQQLISAATLQNCAQALSARKIPVAFGGRIFNLRPELSDSIAGHYLGADLNVALDEIEIILKNNIQKNQPKAASPMYLAAHQAFVAKRPQIEMTVKELLEPLSTSSEEIRTGIHFLGENISAALQLGDMAYVSAELDWLKGLLQFHRSPESELAHFMQIYSQAVNRNINGQGQPISEWFATEIQKLNAQA